jgi:transcriptional regulator with XRE-family HTH domain
MSTLAPPAHDHDAETRLPFGQAATRLKGELSLSQLSRLTRQVDPDGRGVSVAYLSTVVNGHERPSPRVMRLVAEIFGKRPNYFAEYRLASARALLDERGEGGLMGALDRLETMDSVGAFRAP